MFRALSIFDRDNIEYFYWPHYVLISINMSPCTTGDFHLVYVHQCTCWRKKKTKQTNKKNPTTGTALGGGVTLFEKQMNFDDIKRYECTDLLKVNSNFIHVVCWGKNTHKTFNQKLIVIRIKSKQSLRSNHS